MKDRKYSNIRVHREVYVNSQSDYTFHVKIDGFGFVNYDPSCGYYQSDTYQLPRMDRFPKYVREAVDKQVLIRLKAADTVYYEYDRDGNKRYKNLRYHGQERVDYMIQDIERSKP